MRWATRRQKQIKFLLVILFTIVCVVAAVTLIHHEPRGTEISARPSPHVENTNAPICLASFSGLRLRILDFAFFCRAVYLPNTEEMVSEIANNFSYLTRRTRSIVFSSWMALDLQNSKCPRCCVFSFSTPGRNERHRRTGDSSSPGLAAKCKTLARYIAVSDRPIHLSACRIVATQAGFCFRRCRHALGT